jgi:hypothetical protein
MYSTEQLELEKERVLLKGHYNRLAIKHYRQTQKSAWEGFVGLFQHLFNSNTPFPDFKPKGLFFLFPYSEYFYSKKEIESLSCFPQSDPEFLMLYDETAWKTPVALALLGFKRPITVRQANSRIESLGGTPAGRNDLICLYLTAGLRNLKFRKIILATLPELTSEENDVLLFQQFEGPLFSTEPNFGTWSNRYLFASMFPLG